MFRAFAGTKDTIAQARQNENRCIGGAWGDENHLFAGLVFPPEFFPGLRGLLRYFRAPPFRGIFITPDCGLSPGRPPRLEAEYELMEHAEKAMMDKSDGGISGLCDSAVSPSRAGDRRNGGINTNFDHLIKNLENHPELYALVEKIAIGGEQVTFHQYSPMVQQGAMYGLLTRKHDVVAIHNRIYRELIYDYMTTNLEIRELREFRMSPYNVQTQFVKPDGGLDLEKVLMKFQECLRQEGLFLSFSRFPSNSFSRRLDSGSPQDPPGMTILVGRRYNQNRQEYSSKDAPFLERNGRLVFFAFLKPILNGWGFAFKEPQISEEKRLDVASLPGRAVISSN